MKIGLVTSVIGHTILLTWGLISLPGAKPFEVEAIEALPVDLIEISDVTAINEGIKTAPVRETASQAKVEPPKPRPDSQSPGAAEFDQKTPVTEKATDTAATPTAEAPPPPPPSAKPEPVPAEPEEAPEPAPLPVPEAPAPKPTADSGEIAAKPAAEPVEDAPKPVPPTVKPRAKPKPPKPVETADAERPAKPSEATSNSRKDSPEFDPNEMAALLNKVDPSGGGAQASANEASLGTRSSNTTTAKMSQSELDALRAAIEACWNPPIGAEGLDQMMVPIRFEMNPDGSIAGMPVAREIPPGPVGQAMADAALRAVRRCAPYTFLPPEKYETWRTVNINFRPPAMF